MFDSFLRDTGAQFVAGLLCTATIAAAGAMRTAWRRRRQRIEQNTALETDE
ncbi:hypothetical protein [Streptomyces sp. NBC_00299]|uniref:hypothetical protein n=1 Tax=Streptomyces sp. NBC_00299 TaxID=2975705 RepID=UPI002E28EAA9|nr:hypothetical protein [Streptomyces sp. NBC_00299]